MQPWRSRAVALAAASALLFLGCIREARNYRPEPSRAELVEHTRLTSFQAGAGKPVSVVPHPTDEGPQERNEYEENAYALSEGKRLFSNFNCNGCHANGGGGMGPPLMDAKWSYGSEPEQIFSTIVEGRPNGMPSWGGKIPEYQIWQLAAYVRSLSGQARPDAETGRNDDMKTQPPEHTKEPEEPKDAGPAPSAEMPQ